ncbi:DUF4259 domain-containing protein [Streptomyces coelicoflavus]|uniref:DUF4259 domain-containing protein n=1 Tax=Streptomyces coelicoflavus TaxID=285562 RepID=UPI00332C902E
MPSEPLPQQHWRCTAPWRSACTYGLRPAEPLPEFPTDPRALTVDALDQVLAVSSELTELWDEAANGSKWRHDITRLRNVLAPPALRQMEPLFDM